MAGAADGRRRPAKVRQDVAAGFVPHFRRDTDPNISPLRHHPDVQRFLEWCKEKGLLTRYRAFLQRQAEHTPEDVERLMAAIDVGMTRWKWARGRRPPRSLASGGASEESGAIKEEGAASSAPTSAREFAREATRTEPRLIALRT
jgi:hypothetical protein